MFNGFMLRLREVLMEGPTGLIESPDKLNEGGKKIHYLLQSLQGPITLDKATARS